ncbi:MAG: arylsulfatase, partial [Akkermansiaceae bacterium]|nr:arylsulfatase [Akkermansiaceae bacterium]
LYNLKDDLSESTNLAGAEPGRSRQLHSRLRDTLASVQAQIPVPNPDYRPPKKAGQ